MVVKDCQEQEWNQLYSREAEERVAEREEDIGSAVGNVADWSRFGQTKRFRKLAYLDLFSRVLTHVWVCITSSVGREHPGKIL